MLTIDDVREVYVKDRVGRTVRRFVLRDDEIGDLESRLRLFLEALRGSGPDDLICQHHGVSLNCGDDQVTVTAYENAYLLVVVSRSRDQYAEIDYRSQDIGYSDQRFERVRAAIQRAAVEPGNTPAEIFKTWNGANANPTVSVVLDQPCPLVLQKAIQNYRECPDVFRFTDHERRRFYAFHDWVYRRKRAVGLADEEDESDG